jgi:hypothetical protein
LTNTFAAFENVTRNPARLATPLGFATAGKGGVSLEPTVYLDQMKRYLDHLHELRRINEGDDTADSPAYSLNLVRIPVSVLPGGRTDRGHGAEITMTLTPHLGEELLPVTFRNLVTNDLLENIGVPLTQFVNDVRGMAFMEELSNAGPEKPTVANTPYNPTKMRTEKINTLTKPVMKPPTKPNQPDPNQARMDHSDPLWTPTTASEVDIEYNDWLPPPKPVTEAKAETLVKDRLKDFATRPLMERQIGSFDKPTYKAIYEAYYQEIQDVGNDPTTPSAALVSTPKRRALRPLPLNQLAEVFGTHEYLKLAKEVYDYCGTDIPNRDVTHYPDVMAHLQEELSAAHKFLATPEAGPLWHMFCTPDLVSMIRNRKEADITNLRHSFESILSGAAVSAEKAFCILSGQPESPITRYLEVLDSTEYRQYKHRLATRWNEEGLRQKLLTHAYGDPVVLR